MSLAHIVFGRTGIGRIEAHTRRAPKPSDKRCKVRVIFFDQRREFQSESYIRDNVPYHSFGTDLSVGYEEMQFGCGTWRERLRRSNEEATNAEIAD